MEDNIEAQAAPARKSRFILKPTLILFVPIIAFIFLGGVCHIRFTDDIFIQIIFVLFLLLFLFTIIIYFIVQAFSKCISSQYALSISYLLPLVLFALLIAHRNSIYGYVWPIRLALYHHHYATCVSGAVQIGDGNSIGFCETEVTPVLFGQVVDGVIYDSSDKIMQSAYANSPDWAYAALRSNVIGHGDISVRPLSHHFYGWSSEDDADEDAFARNFYAIYKCTGSGAKLICADLPNSIPENLP